MCAETRPLIEPEKSKIKRARGPRGRADLFALRPVAPSTGYIAFDPFGVKSAVSNRYSWNDATEWRRAAIPPLV